MATAKKVIKGLKVTKVTKPTPAPKETYVRNAVITSVHDGDTVGLDLDLGYSVHINVSCRLNGINAPELATPAGKVSAAWLQKKLPIGTALTTQTTKGNESDKYGRYLADLYLPGESVTVNQQLIDAGMAVAWNGTGPKPV